MANLPCDVCGKNISGNYSVLNGKNCCSQKCLEVLLAKCHHCQKPLTGPHMVVDGKKFCSRECAATVLPKCHRCGIALFGESINFISDQEYKYCTACAQMEPCFACQLPEPGTRLRDERLVCHRCQKTAVTSKAEALRMFREVRAVLKTLGYAACGEIQFDLVDRPAMKRAAGKLYNERELGIYRHESQTTTTTTTQGKVVTDVVTTTAQSCSIFVYDHLPTERFMETVAHELGHDWCLHQFGRIASNQISEGVAEYVASRFNEAMGWARNNRRMESNTDPVYGAGYRLIRDIAQRNGEAGLAAWLKKMSQ